MGSGKIIVFSIFILVCGVFASPAAAVEKLSFGEKTGLRVKINIENYLAENKEINITAPLVAEADLNEDGIAEYIVRDTVCDGRTALCTYLLLADTGEGVTKLGQIEARSLLLGNGYSHGVRDIMAQEDLLNDFELRRYVWEPQLSRYTMADSKAGKGS